MLVSGWVCHQKKGRLGEFGCVMLPEKSEKIKMESADEWGDLFLLVVFGCFLGSLKVSIDKIS